jgi:hypothetical protein
MKTTGLLMMMVVVDMCARYEMNLTEPQTCVYHESGAYRNFGSTGRTW